MPFMSLVQGMKLVQSSVQFHVLENHASKEGSNVNMGLYLVHYCLLTFIVCEHDHCTSFLEKKLQQVSQDFGMSI